MDVHVRGRARRRKNHAQRSAAVQRASSKPASGARPFPIMAEKQALRRQLPDQRRGPRDGKRRRILLPCGAAREQEVATLTPAIEARPYQGHQTFSGLTQKCARRAEDLATAAAYF